MFFFMRAHFRPQSVKTRVNFFDPYLPGVKLPVNEIGTLIIRMTIGRQRNARSERDRRIPFRNALSDGARRNERGPAAAGEAAAPKKIPLSNAPAAPTETEVAKTPAPPPASSSGAKNPILHQSNKSPPGTKTPRTPHTPAPGSSAMPQPRPPHPRPDGPMTLTELAVPLRSRIWDLTDGRLVNGEWTRYDWKPNGDLKILEPFGGTVAEFETAMRTELDLPEREAPGVQFIKMIAEHEKYRDAHRNATRSAPVVWIIRRFAHVGVTAPMWEVAGLGGTHLRREFSDVGETRRRTCGGTWRSRSRR